MKNGNGCSRGGAGSGDSNDCMMIVQMTNVFGGIYQHECVSQILLSLFLHFPFHC